MRKKNTVVIKQRDEWSGLAQFLGDMIAKYAEHMDFESLPDPDQYLLERFIRKALTIGLYSFLKIVLKMEEIWKEL